MAFSQANVITTGITTFKSGKDATEACFGSASGLFAGYQPWGPLVGTQDIQGTVGPRRGKFGVADWVATTIGNAGTALTQVATSYPAIGKIITGATADHDGYQYQWSTDGGSTVDSALVPTAATVLIGYFRLKVDNAGTDAHTKSEFFVGVSSTDTAIYASPAAVVGFVKAQGAATMVGEIGQGGTETDTAALSSSLVDNTYIQLGFRVNGVTSIEFWQGTGSTIGGMSRVATQTTVTNIPTTTGALSIAVGTDTNHAATDFYIQHAVAMQEAL